MADYKALIRIRKWALDEQRRQLGQLNAALNRIDEELARLAAEYEREQEAIEETDFIAAAGFGNYTEGMIIKRQEYSAARASVEQQIEAKTEEVRLAFQELKKFELAQEELEAAEEAEQQRLETIELDDIAIEGFARRKGDG
ncbi:MAG: flagellar FliJ family protein [Alphaproteobacteria bacterium]|nr:flagellar FliJ family protein [Alphaproteobacteria bacterium SS10]